MLNITPIRFRTTHLKAQNSFVLLSLFFLLKTPVLFSQTLQTVPFVDLSRYAGKWFEVAAFPQRFQKGCHIR
ncbi:MAG: hypothetical protein EAY81_01030 [Bacteroidetes bacterium]|nr:MAG: hypothetical protein EAY81_01030 [Bacteroidota bacterium]